MYFLQSFLASNVTFFLALYKFIARLHPNTPAPNISIFMVFSIHLKHIKISEIRNECDSNVKYYLLGRKSYMSKNYNQTIVVCFIAYIVQAIMNNFAPLLFLTFSTSFGIPLSKITLLITINFGIQLLVDLTSVYFVDKIGYKKSIIIAHILATIGLVFLGILPRLMDAYTGLLIAVLFYAIGGGLIEVIISPIVEACPSENKEKAMSLLHSFYCWGQVGVVLLSTLFFYFFDVSNWPILSFIWALVPLCNLFFFMNVPVPSLLAEDEKGMTVSELFKNKLFWLLLILMALAGACEQSVSQWASTFAESGLGVSKTVGDLLGPMFFAIMMGSSRTIYGKFGDKLPLMKCMILTSFLCLFSYLLLAFSSSAVIGLLAMGIAGFSVGLLWPGTFSLASSALPRGGTALFALLALGGDIGCSGGPTFVGLFSDISIKNGMQHALIFPIILIIGLMILRKE